MRQVFVLLSLLLWAGTASAVEPDEVLSDPVLENRARLISQGLRCLQCRNESIDESNAGIARDLRLLVRDRLLEGDSDTEVMDYVVARYGEYVLLRPNGLGINLVLWLAGPALFLVSLAGLIAVQRRSKRKDSIDQLTEEEEREIAIIATLDKLVEKHEGIYSKINLDVLYDTITNTFIDDKIEIVYVSSVENFIKQTENFDFNIRLKKRANELKCILRKFFRKIFSY